MLRPASFKLVSVVALIVLLTFVVMNAENTPAIKYDKSAEVKVKGTIDDVITAPDSTVHITLKSDKGSLDVVIGPEKFLKAMEVSYSKGDAVEILGSKVVVDGNAIMVAREVTRNGEVLCARDPRGEPVWVGWIK